MTTRLCEANASFSSTRSMSPTPMPARSSSFRTAGTGPMPITRGSTPATALPTNAPSGSMPSAWARSSLAITSAAAPSLIPLEFPAVTVPPSRKAGLSAAIFSAFVSGRGCSSRVTPSIATSSSSKRPASSAAAQRRCDRSANSSCSSRLTPYRSATFSPVSPIDSSGNISSMRGFGKRQPSVVSQTFWSPRGYVVVGLCHHERRSAHRLDSPRDEEVAVTGCDRMRGRDDRREPRRAEPVHGHAGDRLGQAGEERSHASDVAVVLPAWFAAPK